MRFCCSGKPTSVRNLWEAVSVLLREVGVIVTRQAPLRAFSCCGCTGSTLGTPLHDGERTRGRSPGAFVARGDLPLMLGTLNADAVLCER